MPVASLLTRNGIACAAFMLLIGITAIPSHAQYSGYYFGHNKIQYDDFDWQVLQTDHLDIYYYPEMLELAEHGAFFAEEAYSELQNRFNFSLNHRIPIVFYSSNLHFKQTNVTPGFIPDGVGGFFEFLKGRVVIPANGNLHRFRRVIRHEMVHVFMYNKVLRVLLDHRKSTERYLPLWFTEGLAEYWSGEPDAQHEMVIRDALYTNYLVPLESMYRIRGSFVMYKQGEAFCRFLAERYGEEKLLELLDNFWKDSDFRMTIELTTGDDFEDVSSSWLIWLKEQYYPELVSIDLPSLITDGLSTEGFNAKPTFYQFKDGTRKLYFVGNRSGLSNVYALEVDENYSPMEEPKVLINGGRNDKFEAFHLFESRLAVSNEGMLAFVSKSGGHDVVHVYDLEADQFEQTYAFEDLVAVYSPSWSPDGSRFVFSSIDATGFSDLYIYHVDRAELQRLTNDTYDDRDPSWSPDGTKIAFSSDRTTTGNTGSYNIFTYGVDDGRIRYVTFGKRADYSPSWSPDGNHILYTSAVPDSTGRFAAQDVWSVDMSYVLGTRPSVASLSRDIAPTVEPTWRSMRKITQLAAAAYDPVWTKDDRILFTSFEGLSFSIRQLENADSLVRAPRREQFADLTKAGASWKFKSLKIGEGASKAPFRKRFRLDIAQGAVSQSAVLGTTGGGIIAFSDILGDDHLYLTIFNSGLSGRGFLRDLSFQLARVQLKRRANIGYGIYRYSGRRYDLTDPDAPSGLPIFFESIYGGFGRVSYPLSKFSRFEVATSINWSRKEIDVRRIDREALLLSNSVSFIQDKSLYWLNGPIQGWRAKLSAAYTTDIRYSNVSYYTLVGDFRHYLRIGRDFTFASWVMGRMNQGREARLFVMGGSWDIRGFHLFDVRGQKIWFTSHEFRFPLLNSPSIILPILAPFGVANFRGALFFDAAHAWNEKYHDPRPEINAGETIGALGYGFRLNIFGVLVLRYDIGLRYRDGFKDMDKRFRQFFFGFDF
ncbi:MAG: BamA/TamA family outer membrane protein [Bacteroidetes bacterium]|nr:BamA/TamA family outer membrane protein [Bacteroidota bacterium]